MSKQVNVVLDASMLDTFQLCETRFNYRYNLNKVPPEKSKPLDRGTLVHTGLEVYYTSLAAKEPFDTAVDKMQDAVTTAGISSDLDPETFSRVRDVLIEYFNFWKTADGNWSIRKIESPFSYVLHEDTDIRIVMIGKIDLIVDEGNYLSMPIDHKSYDREYPVNRMSNQFKNYCVATGSNYLLVNKIGFQTTLPAEKKFKRVPVSYDPLILTDWKNDTVAWVNRYIECVATDKWTMNTTSCNKFNKNCDYLEVCDSSGIEAKVYKLEANFLTSEPWDVSKSLGDKK